MRRRHDRDLIEIRRSPRVCRRSGVAAWERTKLVLGHVMESRLLGETREDLCGIALGLPE